MLFWRTIQVQLCCLFRGSKVSLWFCCLQAVQKEWKPIDPLKDKFTASIEANRASEESPQLI